MPLSMKEIRKLSQKVSEGTLVVKKNAEQSEFWL